MSHRQPIFSSLYSIVNSHLSLSLQSACLRTCSLCSLPLLKQTAASVNGDFTVKLFNRTHCNYRGTDINRGSEFDMWRQRVLSDPVSCIVSQRRWATKAFTTDERQLPLIQWHHPTHCLKSKIEQCVPPVLGSVRTLYMLPMSYPDASSHWFSSVLRQQSLPAP